jgi:hypothetical protein
MSADARTQIQGLIQAQRREAASLKTEHAEVESEIGRVRQELDALTARLASLVLGIDERARTIEQLNRALAVLQEHAAPEPAVPREVPTTPTAREAREMTRALGPMLGPGRITGSPKTYANRDGHGKGAKRPPVYEQDRQQALVESCREDGTMSDLMLERTEVVEALLAEAGGALSQWDLALQLADWYQTTISHAQGIASDTVKALWGMHRIEYDGKTTSTNPARNDSAIYRLKTEATAR